MLTGWGTPVDLGYFTSSDPLQNSHTAVLSCPLASWPTAVVTDIRGPAHQTCVVEYVIPQVLWGGGGRGVEKPG